MGMLIYKHIPTKTPTFPNYPWIRGFFKNPNNFNNCYGHTGIIKRRSKVMQKRAVILMIGIIMVSFLCLLITLNPINVKAQGENHNPVLHSHDLYIDGDLAIFEVIYQDEDGNNGSVEVAIDGANYAMFLVDGYPYPEEGQLYEYSVFQSDIFRDTEFFFAAQDDNGSEGVLYWDETEGGQPFIAVDYIDINTNPYFTDPDVYNTGGSYVFEVIYGDNEGDPGEIWLVLNDDWENAWEMQTWEEDPFYGQTHEVYVSKSEANLDTEFYFYAMDAYGGETVLPETVNFVVMDFIENDPILSNPDVYYEDPGWVFNITYRDPDGDVGTVEIWFVDTGNYFELETSDTNPYEGMNYKAVLYPSDIVIDENTTFYLVADDGDEGMSILTDSGDLPFLVGDFLGSENGDGADGNGGDGGGDGDSGGSGFQLPARWGDPEVIVGIIALVAVGGGSAYGVYRRKKKQGRFSDLLTDLDEVYKSYKMNPHKCEIELEKMRALVNEDLKHGVIDENNYSILKERIDELIREIRSDSLHSEVKDIPKELELRIKDMLIDGEISRAEYDKLLPIIMGSEMASEDKEKMEKVVESWMKEDEKTED
jgi:hypothetical protein